MPKSCLADDCENPRFGKGFCKWHQHMRTDKKKPSGIKPISDKKAEDLKVYRKVRDAYLKEITECEVHDCSNKSTHIHHKSGRNGKTLYDDNLFMAVCNKCHPQRIHENPAWSRAMGYII